jgi:phage-related protein
MLFISPQQLAADQLAVLREQRDELKSFNTDLALQISEHVGVQFQTAMAPVASSLSQLNENISTMGEGLGQGAAKAVAEASGGELRALGQTLAALGERLDGLSAVVGSSGDDAARQIRAAGADFAQAAADIREAFDKLATQVDGMGGKLVEQGELAARAQSESLQRVLGGLEAAQSRSSEAMAEAVRSLQGAGAAAAETMQREVGTALASGVEESQRTFRTAVEESGEGLRTAAANLSGAVGAAADQIERASTGFDRSGQSAGRAAQSLDEVAANARLVATSIGDVSTGFTTAAAPVAQAAQAISDAAGRIQRAIDGGRELDAEATRGLIALAEEIRATQAAAQGAWQDYRARFENVDKALATTTGELATTLGNTFGEFSLFAAKVDRELGAAVTKLSDALSAIHDYAEALDDYVEVTARVRVGAAE